MESAEIGIVGRNWWRTLEWRLNRLRSMTPAEVLHRGGRMVRARLQQVTAHRVTVPPMDRLPATRYWVQSPTRLDANVYVERADEIVAGKLTIFRRQFSTDGVPDWNRDPKTGTEAPLSPGVLLDYRDPRRVGDIKYLWEPNRHLHLVTLAQAYALTGRPNYLHVLRRQLDSWFRACPYGRGPNWSSALEVGIRLINWSLAWQLAGGMSAPIFAGEDGAIFRQRWLDAVYEHAWFVRRHFSRHSSANNHLIGEAAGLYIASVAWPCWPKMREWRRTAADILEREALLQTSSDGVDREQALCYQQFVLDFLVLALLAGASAGEHFSIEYQQRLRSMLEFIAAVMDAGGHLPMIGDSDDGAVTCLAPSREFSAFRSLLATGAILFDDAYLKRKSGDLDDKTQWLFGPGAADRFNRIDSSPPVISPRQAFPEGGYYILGRDLDGRDEIKLVVDAGPLGYRSIAAHGHADALSFTLSLGGAEVLIDPGTYLYHGGGAWRRYFRGTAAHNTLRIDAKDQSRQAGDFLWTRRATAHCDSWHSSATVDRFDGRHDGYLRLSDPVLHRRSITLDKVDRRIAIVDHLRMNGSHDVELFFHCSEHCVVELGPRELAIHRAPWTVLVELPARPDATTQVYRGSTEPICGWVSRHYDQRQPSPTIVWRARLTGPVELRTTLMCRSDYAAHT
jgi:hypothetical protein